MKIFSLSTGILLVLSTLIISCTKKDNGNSTNTVAIAGDDYLTPGHGMKVLYNNGLADNVSTSFDYKTISTDAANNVYWMGTLNTFSGGSSEKFRGGVNLITGTVVSPTADWPVVDVPGATAVAYGFKEQSNILYASSMNGYARYFRGDVDTSFNTPAGPWLGGGLAVLTGYGDYAVSSTPEYFSGGTGNKNCIIGGQLIHNGVAQTMSLASTIPDSLLTVVPPKNQIIASAIYSLNNAGDAALFYMTPYYAYVTHNGITDSAIHTSTNGTYYDAAGGSPALLSMENYQVRIKSGGGNFVVMVDGMHTQVSGSTSVSYHIASSFVYDAYAGDVRVVLLNAVIGSNTVASNIISDFDDSGNLYYTSSEDNGSNNYALYRQTYTGRETLFSGFLHSTTQPKVFVVHDKIFMTVDGAILAQE